jgi:hypothetical protein
MKYVSRYNIVTNCWEIGYYDHTRFVVIEVKKHA